MQVILGGRETQSSNQKAAPRRCKGTSAIIKNKEHHFKCSIKHNLLGKRQLTYKRKDYARQTRRRQEDHSMKISVKSKAFIAQSDEGPPETPLRSRKPDASGVAGRQCLGQ